MKKVILLVVSLLLISLPVFASSDDIMIEEVDNQVIIVLDGVAEKMTKEEALKKLDEYNFSIKNNNEMFTDIMPRAGVTYFDKYISKSSIYEFDYSQKKPVTPWKRANTDRDTLSYGESISVSSSFSGNLTTGELNAMASKLGFTYTRTALSNSSFNQTFGLNKGQVGRVVFSPAVIRTSGTLENWKHSDMQLNPVLISTKSVSNAKLLQKVGKFADGIYELELQ